MNTPICGILIGLSFVMGVLIGAASTRCPAVQPHQSIFVTDKGTFCWYGEKFWMSPTPELCEMKDAPK